MSTRSEPRTPGRAIGRRPTAGEHRRWPAVWRPRKRLRRSPLRDRVDLLQCGLEQLPLRVEARALDRLAQRDPLGIVDLAELRRQRAAGVLHQIEIDALANQRVAGAKEIF